MLKVLLIGCGNIAGGFDIETSAGSMPRTHAGAYAAHGHFLISACVDSDASKRASFMKRWGVAEGYASIEELLAHQSTANSAWFDVISICSPTAFHYEHTLLAVQLAPKLIFCEKPVCSDVAQTQSLVQLCDDKGVLLAVNHNRRWDLEVTRLRDQLHAGQWGAVRSVTGQYNKGVLNNGSHMIDLLQNLLGALTLIDFGAPYFDYWESDPSVPANLVSAGGVPIALTCGDANDYSLFELQVVTQRAVIAMEDAGMRWRTRLSAPSPQFSGYRALEAGQIKDGGFLQTMTNAVENIYRAVTSGEPLASTGANALNAQHISHQILARSCQASQTTSTSGAA